MRCTMQKLMKGLLLARLLRDNTHVFIIAFVRVFRHSASSRLIFQHFLLRRFVRVFSWYAFFAELKIEAYKIPCTLQFIMIFFFGCVCVTVSMLQQLDFSRSVSPWPRTLMTSVTLVAQKRAILFSRFSDILNDCEHLASKLSSQIILFSFDEFVAAKMTGFLLEVSRKVGRIVCASLNKLISSTVSIKECTTY